MDPWNTNPTPHQGTTAHDESLHYILSVARQEGVSESSSKRVVYPAVPFMTVKEERKCLSEIRSYSGSNPENFVLSNGMKAEDFALMYVLGHQLKRKDKQLSSLNNNS